MLSRAADATRCQASCTAAADRWPSRSPTPPDSAAQQPRLLEHADRFITVSAFTAAKLIDSGLPRERTDVLPNFVADGELAAHIAAATGGYALAGGRLVPEKGFDTAIARRARRRCPARDRRRRPRRRLGCERSAAMAPTCACSAWSTAGEWPQLRREAAFVVVPSRCDDACPYSVTEALADGVPVIGSTRGGLPELLVGQPTLPADDVDGMDAGDAAAVAASRGHAPSSAKRRSRPRASCSQSAVTTTDCSRSTVRRG